MKNWTGARTWAMAAGLVAIALITTAAAMLVAAHFGQNDWGTLSGIGQLTLGLVLAMYAIVGYRIALEQFREQQARPKLGVFWRDSDGNDVASLQLNQPASGHRLEPEIGVCMLSLVNSGSAVERWYMVSITLPRQIYPEHDPLGRATYEPFGWSAIIGRQGEVGDWRIHNELEPQITFVSNGHWAVYPGWPLLLMQIVFFVQPQREYPESLPIRYHIVGERMEPIDGELALQIVRPVVPMTAA